MKSGTNRSEYPQSSQRPVQYLSHKNKHAPGKKSAKSQPYRRLPSIIRRGIYIHTARDLICTGIKFNLRRIPRTRKCLGIPSFSWTYLRFEVSKINRVIILSYQLFSWFMWDNGNSVIGYFLPAIRLCFTCHVDWHEKLKGCFTLWLISGLLNPIWPNRIGSVWSIGAIILFSIDT